MPRGGKRTPTAGKTYPNRTDLGGQVPAQAAPGQPYGAAGEQMAAQRAVPMAAPMIQPGAQGAFDRPTERPDEPITAGLDIGPGPGSEVLGLPDEDAQDLESMRTYLPRLELMASHPTSTPAFRNYVRRLRSSIGVK